MNTLPIQIDYTDKQILETLRNTVAVGATPSEFALFLEYCKSTGLNPFKKEIWFIKADGRIQMMTGINGFWSLANSFSEFDGAEVGLIDRDGNWVKSVPDDTFIGAWCRVYRKDRKIPMEGEALLSDYRKGFGLWRSAPRIMIKKVAESIALRKAFPQQLNGLYTQEEMPNEYQTSEANKQTVEVVEVSKGKVPHRETVVSVEPVRGARNGDETEQVNAHFQSKSNGYAPEPVLEIVSEPVSASGTPKRKRLQKPARENAFEKLATFYDLSSLSGDTLQKARAYLIDACSKEVKPNVFRCPVKMGKLTSLIIAPEALEEGSQDDVTVTPSDIEFPNV